MRQRTLARLSARTRPMSSPGWPTQTGLSAEFSGVLAAAAPARFGADVLALSGLMLGLLLAQGCGTGDAGSGTCVETTSTGVDKIAVAALNDEAGAALASYSFDANLVTTRQFVFVLTNTASLFSAAPLSVKAISLVETDDTGKAVTSALFKCEGPTGKPCVASDFPAVIPGGFKDDACTPKGAKTGANFTVVYNHEAGASARKAVLHLELDGDPTRKTLDVTFATALGKPKFTCDADVVDFGSVKAGAAPVVETFSCRSVGTAPVVLERAELFSTSAPPLKLTFSGQTVAVGAPYTGLPAITIPPQGSIKLTATLGGLVAEEKIGATLKLTTNDFTAAETTVQFKANSSGPCLKPNPSTIDFGDVGVGVPKPIEVQLQGCGTEAVTVTSIALDPGASDGLKLDFTTGSFTDGKGPTATDALIVQPNATASFRVICTPVSLTAVIAGTVRITSSNADARTIPVSCTPAKLACPVACFDVQPGVKVVPQTELTFNSACSKAGGTQVIDKRKWSVTQPKGAPPANFSPNATGKEVKFTPNVVGTYEFALEVFDDLGKPGCQPEKRTIEVVPDDKLHIELTWTTKGDPVVGDDKGADLDLHLAHPLASSVPGQPDLDGNGEPDPWWARCYDCFWFNPTPKWGDAFDVADNPSVERDDADGEGPENLSVKVPETNTWYTIGAYTWSDGKFGASLPRIRIFIDKELVFDKTGPALNTGDMWCAAQVSYDPLATTTNAKVKLIKACKGADGAGNLVTHNYPQFDPKKPMNCE